MTWTSNIDSDRRRIADLSRWAHNSGWTDAGWRGFQNARFEDQATIAVRPNETGFEVWRKPADAPHFTGVPTEYPADSVQQALNLLAAIEILPPSFSAMYWAGWHGAADESPASVVSTPTPRCRNCGATAGLRTYLGTPLALKHPQWVCASGCKGGLK